MKKNTIKLILMTVLCVVLCVAAGVLSLVGSVSRLACARLAADTDVVGFIGMRPYQTPENLRLLFDGAPAVHAFTLAENLAFYASAAGCLAAVIASLYLAVERSRVLGEAV